MPKRAWCSGCRSYVMLTAEDMCPYGHPKPSLRGVEEVGYGAPPSQLERQPVTEAPMSYEPAVGYSPSTTTASGPTAAAATYGSDATSSGYGAAPVADAGGYAPTGYGAGTPAGGGYGAPASPYGGGYDSAAPSGGYGAGEPTGGYGAPTAPGAAFGMAGAAAQPSMPMGNPWQTDAMGIDPMLQMQLNQDAARMYRDVPWTQSWVGIVIFLFFFWPAGLVFLWRSPLPTDKTKWGITAAVVSLIAFNLARFALAMAAVSASSPVIHP